MRRRNLMEERRSLDSSFRVAQSRSQAATLLSTSHIIRCVNKRCCQTCLRFRGLLPFVLLLKLMSAANNVFAICSETVRAIRLLPEFENSIEYGSP